MKYLTILTISLIVSLFVFAQPANAEIPNINTAYGYEYGIGTGISFGTGPGEIITMLVTDENGVLLDSVLTPTYIEDGEDGRDWYPIYGLGAGFVPISFANPLSEPYGYFQTNSTYYIYDELIELGCIKLIIGDDINDVSVEYLNSEGGEQCQEVTYTITVSNSERLQGIYEDIFTDFELRLASVFGFIAGFVISLLLFFYLYRRFVRILEKYRG